MDNWVFGPEFGYGTTLTKEEEEYMENNKNKVYEAEIDFLKADNEYLKGQIKKLEEEVKKLDVERKRAKDLTNSQLAVINDIMDDNEKLKDKLKDLYNEGVEAKGLLMESIDDLNDRIDALKAGNEHLQWKIKRLEEEDECLKERVKKLMEENETLNDQNDILTAENEALKKLLNNMDDRYNNLWKEKEELRKRLADCKFGEVADCSDDVKNVKRLADEVYFWRSHANQKESEFEKTLKEKIEEIDRLYDENESLREAVNMWKNLHTLGHGLLVKDDLFGHIYIAPDHLKAACRQFPSLEDRLNSLAEECSELAQACLKKNRDLHEWDSWVRGQSGLEDFSGSPRYRRAYTFDNLTDEMAHVLICMKMVCSGSSISDTSIQARIEDKYPIAYEV